MGLLDRFFGRNPEHVVRDLLQQSNGLKVGDLPRFQQRFAARLRELGEPAVDPLIAQFDDASGNPRFLIAQSLAAMSAGDFGTDTGVRIRDWLITALKDKDPTVRDVVAMHICRCRDVAVLEPLIRCALGDPSKGTRDIARDSALKFIAELHRLPAEARHDFEPRFQQLRAACADFPEDDITHALDALARTTTSAETPVSVEAGETASVPGPQGPSNVDSLLSAIMEHAPILIGDTSQEERLAKLSSLGPSIVPNIDSAIERFIDTQGEHSTSHYQNAGMLCEMMGKLGGEEALGRLSRYANATSNIWEYKYIREGAKRGLASLSQTSAAVAGHDSKPSNKSVHLQKPQGQDARESMLREEAVVSDSETPWRTHPTPEAEVAGALSRVVFEGGEKSYLDVYADRSRGLFVQFLVVRARSEILGCLPGNGLLSEEDALGHGAIGDLVQRGWSLDSHGYFFEKRWDLGDEEVTVEGVVREGLEALGGAYGVEVAAPLDMELNLGTDGGSTAQVGQDDRVQVLIQELARVIGSGLDMSAVARVRELGEELNRIGGMSLMIDASMKASEINPRVRGFLGKWWDGVGDWVD